MNVSLATEHGATYFNIIAPGNADVAMFDGTRHQNPYEGTLPARGDYKIRVFMMRQAARRNEVARYRLEMTVGGSPQAGARESAGTRNVSGQTSGGANTGVTQMTTRDRNPLAPGHRARWTVVPGPEGMAEELTLSGDPITGEQTRLTRFLPGADTAHFGSKTQDYPEDVLIVSGGFHDAVFGRWIEPGDDANRPPVELDGLFKTDVGCVALEVSFPNRSRLSTRNCA